MSSSYRTRINRLLSHLTVGSRVDFGKRRGPRQRGSFFEFLETRQLLTASPADTLIAGPISHAPFNFGNVTFQVNTGSGNLTNIEFTTLPANGTLTFGNVTVVANSTDIPVTDLANLTYTANPGFGGAEVFQWDGSDGSGFSGSPANLTITVNHQPTLGALSDSVAHDHSLTFPASQFINAYSDADSNPMQSITFVSVPAHGTLKLNGNTIASGSLPIAQFTGNLTYTPSPGYSGPDSFDWNASDGLDNAAANATYSLTVTDTAPTLTTFSANLTHDQQHTFAAADFTSHFADADNDTLQTVTIATLPAHGNLTLGNTTVTLATPAIAVGLLGTLVYTPNAGFSGADSFTWNASDGALSAASNATVSLNVVENRPTLTDTIIHAGAGSNTSIPSNTFVTNFHDADADTIHSVVIKTVPAHGTLMLTSNGTTVAPNQTLSFADLSNLVFVPGAGYTSSDSFTWNASDGIMSAASDATLTLTTDNAPVIKEPFFDALVIHQSHTFSLADFDPTGNGSGTTRYTDADHNPLVSITITAPPIQGTLTLNGLAVVANQTIAAADISGLVYTPNSDTQTADAFTFTASDGTLSSAPSPFALAILDPSKQNFANLTVTVGENRAHTILLKDITSLANSTVGFPLPLTTLKIITLPAHGTLTSGGLALAAGQIINPADVTYTPAAGYTGGDSFTWTESPDNNVHFATPGTVNITVKGPTDVAFSKFVAKDTANSFTSAEFSSHFNAVDGGTFFGIQITKLPTNGVLKLGSVAVGAGQVISSANIASLTYTPKAGYTGADSFFWAGGDGVALATPVAVNLTVLPALSIVGNGQLLPQNAKPSVVNFTDFRNWTLAADASMGKDTRSFTIQNNSTHDMSFSGISSIGANRGDFVIIAPDRARLTNGAFVLAPGDSATFSVQFVPLGIGLRSSVIAVRDGNGAIVYQFAVQGTALASRNVPTTSFDTNGRVNGLVQVATTRNGSGPAAANGHILAIKYTGYLASNGFVFDSSDNPGHPDTLNGLEFRLDDHYTDGSTTSQPFLVNDPNFSALHALNMVDTTVIAGWEFGLQGIKAGEKRTLIINTNAGYGSLGNGNVPPGATLVFDVECVLVDPPPTIVMATIVQTTDSNGNRTNTIFPLASGQRATSASNGTLLSISNTSSSSSVTQTFNFFTIAADDIHGNILANVTFNKKALTITGQNWPDFSNATFTTNQFGPAVQVTFHPLTTGLKTIQIHVNSNDAHHPDYNFILQGNALRYTDIAAGFDGSLNLPTKPVIAGSGQTVPVAVTITNSGDTRLPAKAITNVQIYAHNVTTGALTLVGFLNNVNIGRLGAGAFRIFTPQIPLPLDSQSPFSKFAGGTYTFTAVVNQANVTANASISGLVTLPPKFATMAEGDGSGTKMTDNNTSDSANATINSKKPVNRGITVLSGQYVLSGSLGTSTIIASPATGAHGAITINVKNSGNIQAIPSQMLSIDLFARPIANNNLPTITLVSDQKISAGHLGVGATTSLTIPVAYNSFPRFQKTTYLLFARVRLIDSGGHIVGVQQVIAADGNFNPVLLQA